ncbi:MAG TPA: hypothetical protein VMT99_02140 [Candidatus Paceibacterota bacterium]|nr:hypothetical protein [Candidatus Paceibacterota bacterium]
MRFSIARFKYDSRIRTGALIALALCMLAAARPAHAALLFNQPADQAASKDSWYGDNWYDLGRGTAGTISSITLEGKVNAPEYAATQVTLQEFSDAGYAQLVRTFPVADGAVFTDILQTVTFSNLSIRVNPDHYYRLVTVQDYQNSSVILQGVNGQGIAMTNTFLPGIGRSEGYYPFYPFIIASGTFDEPLVIVPGVMGSALVGATGTAAAGREFWPAASEMANSPNDDYLDALALAPDGTQVPGRELAAGDIIRSVSGTYDRLLIPIPFDERIYGTLIDTFENEGFVEGRDLFVAPYDWRMGVASSSAVVGSVIERAAAQSPDGKVNVIAHSMGGLAVKDFLVRSGSAGAALINSLILVGVPQLGAPATFKALQYGDDLGFGIGPVSLLNPREVKAITQNMPGIYDLLPSRRFVGVHGPYVVREGEDDAGNETTLALDFDETNALLTADPIDARNPALLARADGEHETIDGGPLPSGPRVYNLVGCQDPTVDQYVVHDDGSVDVGRANGDGTVPVLSAMDHADGYTNIFTLYGENGIDHDGLIRDARTIMLFQAIVDGSFPSLALPPLGLSVSSEDCLEGRGAPRPVMTEVTVTGGASADLYDGNGNHTGPNAAGDIENGIPGSSYEAFGSTTVVTAPASGTLRVVIGTGSAGSSTAKSSAKRKVAVKTYDSRAVAVATSTWSDVALADPTSTAVLSLQAVPVLAVDGVTVEPDGTGTAPVHIPSGCPP